MCAIEQIIENAERLDMQIYIYYIFKSQTVHIKLIVSACQNVFYRSNDWKELELKKASL